MNEDFVCDRIRYLRNKRGISAREMSLYLGLNESYINKIETQQRSLPMDVFFRICEYFEITPSQFFNGDCKIIDIQDSDILKYFHKLPQNQAVHFLEIIKFAGRDLPCENNSVLCT